MASAEFESKAVQDETHVSKDALTTKDCENAIQLDEKTSDTFEKAQEYYELSKKLMKQNELEAAIDAGWQACDVGDKSANNLNDIRLADFYLQYGKCLLYKLQQSKGMLAEPDTEIAETEVEAQNENENENENKVSNDGNDNKNGKAEIEDAESESDSDVDINEDENENENERETNKLNENRKDDNDTNEEQEEESNDENDENEIENENEMNEEDSLRAVCWEMLDTARFIVQNYLQTQFGAKLDLNENETENGVLNDINENEVEMSEKKKENEKEKQTERETEIEREEDGKDKKEEELESESEKEEMEELEKKYTLMLAETHMLCGEHQLEDSEFERALESFETAIGLKDLCEDTQRELAYSHFYAAMAASHAKMFDVMEQHCNEAKDLLNDKILSIIDSFENEKYNEKTQDENLDEEGLIALVNEFKKEYENNNLNEEEKKQIDEIGELIVFLEEINNKMNLELDEYSELRKIEAEQGQTIREIVMQAMLNQGNENEMNLENNNNNNNNNIEVSGIAFGTNESSNLNKKGEENENNIVNTLVVKTQSNKQNKKRTFEEAELIEGDNDDSLPLDKKPKVGSKKDLEDVMGPIEALTTESKQTEN